MNTKIKLSKTQLTLSSLLLLTVFSASADNNITKEVNRVNTYLNEAYAYITVKNSGSYQMYTCDDYKICSSINETKLFTELPSTHLTLKVLNSSAKWMCYPFLITEAGPGLIQASGESFNPSFTASPNLTQQPEKPCDSLL
ncbi:MAG: hypothetical protein ACRC5A_01230 [Enterobacteriaceae bacterium]